MRALTLVFFFLIPLAVPSAYAEIEKGINYDRELLHAYQNGTQIFKWTSTPERIIDYYDGNGKPVYAAYRLFQDQNIIQLETKNSGSFVFDKSTCAYNLYNAGYVNEANTPKIKGISWTVKGKLASSQTWTSVNLINSASCQANISTTEKSVTVTGTKASILGTFQIELKHESGKGIKETLRAYNNNPVWNNRHIGFTETFEVPQFITLGNKTYNLANMNDTTLDRNWIGNNTGKLMKLTDKLVYDFGIGFDNLKDILIIWDGQKAKLALNYLYVSDIIPYQTWFEVDPTFGFTGAASYNSVYADGAAASCPTNATVTKYVGDNLRVGKADTAQAVGACDLSFPEWDTTTIPDALGTVTNTRLRYDVGAVVNGVNCSFAKSSYRPSTASGGNLYGEAVGSPIFFVTDDADCTTVANDKILDLGTTADAQIKGMVNGGLNWFGMIIRVASLTRDASDHVSVSAAGPIELEVTYTISPPNPITTLHTTEVTASSADLAWTAPNMNGGTLQRYVMNYTTPCGTPLTILPNGTTATSYTISGLTPNTCYSFRASAATENGFNIVGANIRNVTTLAFNQANFTIGSFNFEADNPLIFPIRFERIDNGTANTLVNITFANSVNLACDLRFTYAGTNRTYLSIPSIPVSSSEREASFRFVNATNEITTFYCWNKAGNQTANYVLTQTDFLLLQQIREFRDGTYGTQGNLGAFDFITLVIVIIAMIGLNRTNEAVGGFFCIAAVSALAFFEIIQWYVALIAGLAVIIMLAISSTRKD